MKKKPRLADPDHPLAKLAPEDWKNSNNAEITRKTGCGYSTVSAVRQRLIRQEIMAGRSGDIYQSKPVERSKKLDPELCSRITELDWRSLTNRGIAEKFGCSYTDALVMRLRLIRAKKLPRYSGDTYVTRRKSIDRTGSFDWSRIALSDWSQRNNHSISQKVRCSATDVRTKRQQLIDEARKKGGTGREFEYKRPK